MSTGNKMQWEWKGCPNWSRPFSYHIGTAKIYRTSALVHRHQGWNAFFERRTACSLSLGHCSFSTLDYAVWWRPPKMCKLLEHIFTIVRNLFLSLFSSPPPFFPITTTAVSRCGCRRLSWCRSPVMMNNNKQNIGIFCSSFVNSWMPFFRTSCTVFVLIMPTAKKCLGSRAMCIFYRIVELYR